MRSTIPIYCWTYLWQFFWFLKRRSYSLRLGRLTLHFRHRVGYNESNRQNMYWLLTIFTQCTKRKKGTEKKNASKSNKPNFQQLVLQKNMYISNFMYYPYSWNKINTHQQEILLSSNSFVTKKPYVIDEDQEPKTKDDKEFT